MSPPFLPPQAPQAEQMLLGLLLTQPELATPHAINGKVFDPAHFADPAHGAIYAAITHLAMVGTPITLETVRQEFERERPGELDEVGGPAYLAQLAAAVDQDWMVRSMMSAVLALSEARALVDQLAPEPPLQAPGWSTSNALVLRAPGKSNLLLIWPGDQPGEVQLLVRTTTGGATAQLDRADTERIHAWLGETLARRAGT